jgi:hypothetical protein
MSKILSDFDAERLVMEMVYDYERCNARALEDARLAEIKGWRKAAAMGLAGLAGLAPMKARSQDVPQTPGIEQSGAQQFQISTKEPSLIGQKLHGVQRFFGQKGEKWAPTYQRFQTSDYEVIVHFDPDGTVGQISWAKNQDEDKNNLTTLFTQSEVEQLLKASSKVEWKRGADDAAAEPGTLVGAHWVGSFKGKPTFEAAVVWGERGDTREKLSIATIR